MPETLRLRPEQLPSVQQELSVLLSEHSAFLRGVQEGRLPADEATLKLAAETYSTLLSSLDDLGVALNTLSLEPLSLRDEDALERTFTLLRRCQEVVQALLTELGRRAAAHPLAAHAPTLEPPLLPPTRIEGDFTLPEGGTLLAVWLVELPDLEPPPHRAGGLFNGGDFLGVAYRLMGDPPGVQRLSSRFRHARGEDRSLEYAPWMDGDKVSSVEEVIRTFTQVAGLLAQQARQPLMFQEVRRSGAELRAWLERERPRWARFVSV